MKPTIKRSVFFVFLCAAITAAYLAGCTGRDDQRGKLKSRVIAKVNNYEITTEDIADEVALSGVVGRYRSGVPAKKMKQKMLNDMIIRQLLLEEAQRENLDKGREFLKEIENYWRQTLIKLLLNKKNNELQFVAKVSEDEIAREYERYRRTLKAQMVVLKDQAAATRLSAAGAGFEAMLAEMKDKVVRQPEAEWWRAGEMPYQLENIVFALKAGEVSKPFMTNGEWVVAKVIDEEEAAEIKPLRQIRGKIRGLLLREKKEQELNRWLAYLESRAKIQRCSPGFDALEVNLEEPRSGGINGE